MNRTRPTAVLRLASAVLKVTACALTIGSPAALAGTLELERCSTAGSRGLCGTVTVFEDRAAGTGRTIDLNVFVLPARNSRKKLPDPIFFLHGGPGGAATDAAPLFDGSPLRERRDIVLVDQRGTGESNPLECPIGDLDDAIRELGSFAFADVEGCRDRLQKSADLALYTTPIAMDDLDDVRRAFGADKINLIGGSYGTRAALVYMRRHGEHVRSAILRGVYPPARNLPTNFARDSQAALFDVLDDCAANGKCDAAYPDLRGQFDRVLKKLERQPTSATVTSPISGTEKRIPIDRDTFVAMLHYLLYIPSSASQIPSFIAAADDGDFEPALRSVSQFVAALAGQLSMGMFMSVVCAEDVPFYADDEIVLTSTNTLLGETMSRSIHDACRHWPQGKVPEGYKDAVRSPVPTLLISGEVDPVTPPHMAAKVAETLPNSLHVIAPNGSHAPMYPGCTAELVESFLDSASVKGLDPSCALRYDRPAFRIR